MASAGGEPAKLWGILPRPDDDYALLQMRLDVRESDGIYSLVFLKSSWVRRGFRYWWCRFWASVLYLFCLAFVGGLAFGFGVGISHVHQPVLRIVLLSVYALTAVPGFIVAWNGIGAGGFPAADDASGPTYGSGCLALIIAPIATGLCLAVFIKTLRPNFPGEKAARRVYEDYRSGADPWSPFWHHPASE